MTQTTTWQHPVSLVQHSLESSLPAPPHIFANTHSPHISPNNNRSPQTTHSPNRTSPRRREKSSYSRLNGHAQTKISPSSNLGKQYVSTSRLSDQSRFKSQNSLDFISDIERDRSPRDEPMKKRSPTVGSELIDEAVPDHSVLKSKPKSSSPRDGTPKTKNKIKSPRPKSQETAFNSWLLFVMLIWSAFVNR